jgi:hypothetical protein
VLRDDDPQRAQSVLDAGWTSLQARANHAGGEAYRRSLLENIPSHRELLQEWERLAAAS